MNLKCLFNNHDFEIIAKHKSSQQNLWKCKRCGIFYIQHYGINCGYKIKKPNLKGWIKV